MQAGAGWRKGLVCAGTHVICGPMDREETRPAPQGGTETKTDAIPAQKPGEIGGPKGPEPTRYGDWEVGGRCTDF